VLDAECQDAFKNASQRAVAALPKTTRRALRHHYRDGHSIDVLAEAWGVHRATAARRLAAARRQLRDTILETMEAKFGMTESSAIRFVRGAQSRLEWGPLLVDSE
jgi:DNA-directed RNA polymerase specialized sigma24 family protein